MNCCCAPGSALFFTHKGTLHYTVIAPTCLCLLGNAGSRSPVSPHRLIYSCLARAKGHSRSCKVCAEWMTAVVQCWRCVESSLCLQRLCINSPLSVFPSSFLIPVLLTHSAPASFLILTATHGPVSCIYSSHCLECSCPR